MKSAHAYGPPSGCSGPQLSPGYCLDPGSHHVVNHGEPTEGIVLHPFVVNLSFIIGFPLDLARPLWPRRWRFGKHFVAKERSCMTHFTWIVFSLAKSWLRSLGMSWFSCVSEIWVTPCWNQWEKTEFPLCSHSFPPISNKLIHNLTDQTPFWTAFDLNLSVYFLVSTIGLVSTNRWWIIKHQLRST